MTRTFGTISVLLLVVAGIFTIMFYAITPAPQSIRNLAINQNSIESSAENLFAGHSAIKVSLPMGRPFDGHAIIKHGEHAIMAEDCGFNPTMTLYNPETNQFADLCQTSSGKFGAFIYEIVDNLKREVTSFEKDKMSRLEQVLNYMKNRNYINEPPVGTPGIIQP